MWSPAVLLNLIGEGSPPVHDPFRLQERRGRRSLRIIGAFPCGKCYFIGYSSTANAVPLPAACGVHGKANEEVCLFVVNKGFS